jgi:transcriptional regulator with XRE-family HTH domain
MSTEEREQMDSEAVWKAREKLGKMWKSDKTPLTRRELALALGLSSKNGSDHVGNMESGKSKVSGTIEMLIRIYLGGGVPPDDVVIFEEPKQRGRAA